LRYKLIIYKILRAEEWAVLRDNGKSQGAPIDIKDGYIHFSTANTVSETANKYFKNEDDLMLLAFNDTDLGKNLKYEKSRGGLLFPHLYDELNLDDALWIKPLIKEGKSHVFPEDLK
tara:strand:- start:394 stop:744 length:351 start_codon:yes stop_codon:yes gene_type:complete